MAFIDYYKVLGVQKDIPQNEIKAAYHKRSKQFHPDLHPEDPKAKAKFQLLNEAYEVLSDPDKRAKYDKYGEQWKNAGMYEGMGGNPFGQQGYSQGFEGFSSGGDFNFNMNGGGFSEFFEQLFGQGRKRNTYSRSTSQNKPTETQSQIDIDMYTAILGGEIIIQLPTGKLKLKVKPGTQPGAKVRLKGKGSQRTDGTFNDLIITYNVKLPTSLTERQKSLLEQMRNS